MSYNKFEYNFFFSNSAFIKYVWMLKLINCEIFSNKNLLLKKTE